MFQCRKRIGHVCLFYEGMFLFCFLSCRALLKCNTERNLCKQHCICWVLLKSLAPIVEAGSQILLWRSLLQQFTCREVLVLWDWSVSSCLTHSISWSQSYTPRLFSVSESFYHMSYNSFLQFSVACKAVSYRQDVSKVGVAVLENDVIAFVMCLGNQSKIF